ncbi:thioredoxin domain-containing protein [Candidatus Acetothermia bacterium]|nr:thioredoxin domain-containing protein [Candidatus Acetothermia bacterium]
MANLLELSKENYEEEVLQADLPVMVDFWGPRCDKCSELMPIVETLAQKYAGKVKFATLDCSKNRRLAIELSRIQMLRLPAFWIYKDGEVLSSLTGEEATAEAIEEELKRVVSE